MAGIADMKLIFSLIVSAVVLTALFVNVVAAQSETVVEMSVCDLAKLGKEMDHRHVRLKAAYWYDARHGAFVKDRKCPKIVIDSYDSSKKPEDPSMKSFHQAQFDAFYSYSSLQILAVDVTGEYRWREDVERRHGLLQSHHILIIEKVWSVKPIHGDWKKAK
jgi:hypothetical protein